MNPVSTSEAPELSWVFGYGSLVWRPAFAYVHRRVGWVEGWSRRFWQGSTDHRGVPGAPGRVVTLVEEPGARCWGVAFQVDPDQRLEVLAQLDHREKGGYDRRIMTFHDAEEGGRTRRVLVYLATSENENYLGPASLEAIADQVLRSVGPSGANLEYVLRLAHTLRLLGADDEHVFALAALVESRHTGHGGA